MIESSRVPHVVVIGAGFAGLSAAWELTRRGVRVTVCEAEEEVGGLAGSFEVGGTRLEKFYHHWFTSDTHVVDLVRALGREGQVLHRPTRTGMYYAHQFFRLSTPLDVLRFTPLSILSRLRLGLLALRARRVRDWQELEHLTGEEVLAYYRGGFAALAEQIAADISGKGGSIRLGSPVTGLQVSDGQVVGVE